MTTPILSHPLAVVQEGTGRVVMWREMGITNSYTMEATFCGSLLGKMAGYQVSTSDLEAMGYHFCDTLLDYCDPDQSKVRLHVCPIPRLHVL